MTFVIKYTNRADADHLMSALKEMYVSDDWTDARFCELTDESISRSVIDGSREGPEPVRFTRSEPRRITMHGV